MDNLIERKLFDIDIKISQLKTEIERLERLRDILVNPPNSIEPPNDIPFRGLPVKAVCALLFTRAITVDGNCLIYVNDSGVPQLDDYPIIQLGQPFSILRVVAEIWYSPGVPLTRRDVVCHTCDYPPCIAPWHLVLANQSFNIKDMYSKGRQGIRKRRFNTKGYRIED